jgi:hypothetical protein
VIVIPVSKAILAVVVHCEVRDEIWGGLAHDMEDCEEEPGKGADRAQLGHPMSKCAVLINTALLIVFGVIRESSQDLKGSRLSQGSNLFVVI